jgi:hypothetical protein
VQRSQLVAVIGTRFADASQLSCRFGTHLVVPATYVSPQRLTCRVPALAPEGEVALSVANDGVSFADVATTLFVRGNASVDSRGDTVPDLVLAGWSPLRAPVGAALSVRVRCASHSLRASAVSLRCRFGQLVVPALGAVDDENEFRCAIPAQPTDAVLAAAVAGVPLSVPLAVSVDAGAHWATHRSSFVYDDDVGGGGGAAASGGSSSETDGGVARLDSFTPSEGAPGTVVTALGDRFLTAAGSKRMRALCRFDKTVVAAAVESGSRLTCVVPKHSGGLFSFQVSNDGMRWSQVGKFRVEASATPPVVESVSPVRGMPGTLVTLFGDGFENSEHLMCRFSATSERHESAIGLASYMSATAVHCEVPSSLNAGERFTLEASNNGEQWSPARQPPVLFQVDSDLNGGAGDFESDSDPESPDDPAPPLEGAAAAGTRGRVSSLAPRRGPSGTTVVLSGADFDARRRYRCRFGAAVVSGVFVSPQRVECDAPLRSFPGPVFVALAADGDDFGDTDDLAFEYVRGLAVPLIYTVVPSAAAPGTNVTVFGRRFVASANLCCLFGALRSHATPVDLQQRDKQRMATAVQCEVPPQLRSGETAELRVANNGCVDVARGAVSDDDEHQRVISHDVLSVAITHAVPQIDSIEPRVPTRGALIVLHGRSFEPGDKAACRFGAAEAPSSAALASPLRYVSEQSASCVVPHQLAVPESADRANPGAAFAVSLSVTNDGATWSLTPFAMRVHVRGALPVVRSIWPLVGDGQGGTVVQVSGEHMDVTDARQVLCRFGKAVVPALRVDDAADGVIECVSPSRAAASGGIESGASLRAPLTVDVDVSFDGGRQWTSSQQFFTFSSFSGSWTALLTLVFGALLALFGVPGLFIALILFAHRQQAPWLMSLLAEIEARTSRTPVTSRKRK